MSQQSSKNTKKPRTARASPLQLTKMLDYFYINKGLAEGKFLAQHGKEEFRKKWIELSNELNSLNGATKTPEQWQVVWRDYKSRVSIKTKDLRKARAATGNKAITSDQLSDCELRVIGITGADYIEGNPNCADSIPEEEELQVQLEHGDDSVLSAPPKVMSICTGVAQEPTEDSQSTDFICHDDFNSQEDDCLNEDSIVELLDSTGAELSNIPLLGKRKKTPYKRPSSEEVGKKGIFPPNIKTIIPQKKCKRLKPNIHSFAENFESIAQKQADAETMLAEAAVIQAEASKMNALAMTEIARAVNKLADTAAANVINDRERTRVFEKLIPVLENLLPNYLHE